MTLEQDDRFGRFFPVLLALTLLAAILEGLASIVFAQPALATASVSTMVFSAGVLIAGYQIRSGRPVRARVALAITVTAFGAIGGYLIPGVGHATALLPILSVILVLPYVARRRLIFVVVAAVASAIAILVVDEVITQAPAIPGLAGVIFQDSILLGVLLLVLVGLADFAMVARDSLRNMEESTERQVRVTNTRLAIVTALRVLHTLPTPEATAGCIATALADLPLVDYACLLEVTDDGLAVLALAGPDLPIQVGYRVDPSEASYLMERSRAGAWAERWDDRMARGPGVPGPKFEAHALAPILSGDQIVGLIVTTTNDPEEAARLFADLPSVSEAASVAGTILAPSLVARRQLGTAKVRIARTITAGAFHPVFQPIVDLDTGMTVGFEALTRFATGDAPDRVFADAARVGLGRDLEAATLAAAVRDAARLPLDAWLSLNVSPSFLGEPERLIEILSNRTRPITLEITEHEVISDYAPIHAAMRALGPDVRLAVDDAGAGVANFRHLVELRPALVKIDAGLIHGVNADVSRQALIVGIVHFAAASGAMVLAEGVETQAEHDTIQRLGVTLAQGYLLARPAPIDTWTQEMPVPRPSTGLGKIVPLRKRA